MSMHRILHLASIIFIATLLGQGAVFASAETHEYLSVSIKPNNPKQLRTAWDADLKAMRAQLGADKDSAGYNWFMPLQRTDDLHISLLTFKKSLYTSEHVRALKRVMGKHKDIVPQEGSFLRAELWLKKNLVNGTTVYTHWVHPQDLTLTEQRDDKTKFFDAAVRSLDEATRHESTDGGCIVLRYATQSGLAKKVGEIVSELQTFSKKDRAARHLENQRDDYGTDLTAHMTIARITRVKGDKKSDQQPISGENFSTLIKAFKSFRNTFQAGAEDKDFVNPHRKVRHFKAEKALVTSGLREKKTVMMTIVEGAKKAITTVKRKLGNKAPSASIKA